METQNNYQKLLCNMRVLCTHIYKAINETGNGWLFSKKLTLHSRNFLHSSHTRVKKKSLVAY